jgi:hypothetical protein
MIQAIERQNKAKWREIEQRNARVRKKILEGFDRQPYDGPKDCVYRKDFKQGLKDSLMEYLADRYAAYLSDSDEFSNNWVVRALEWKANKSLKFLRTLAQQGDADALRCLVKLVVPLVKVINEQAEKIRNLLVMIRIRCHSGQCSNQATRVLTAIMLLF